MKEANCLVLHRLIFFVILLSLGFERGYSQNAERQKTVFSEEQTTKTAPTVPLLPGPALEGPVDPTKYFVGPSDILAVNIWTSPPINFILTVTPEGSLIIPSVAEVRVADMTLAEAKIRVIAEVRRRYLVGNATVTLISPREVIVNVLGTVKFPGSYTLHSTDRVDKAIHAANEPPKNYDPTKLPASEWDHKYDPTNASQRNIWLKHRDGSITRVDLLMFYAKKDDRWNPYLREGDEIVVPNLGAGRWMIGVYGAVNSPGSFEMVQGDRVLDAIELAHGFFQRAIKDSIILTRYDESGHILTDHVMNANFLADSAASNVVLQPGDRIIVKQRLEERRDYHVSIEGEVLYPGTYPITKDRTRLSEIIRRSGGFTEYASLASAMVVRSPVASDDIPKEQMVMLRGNTWPPDTSYVRTENEIRLGGQLAGVDFVRLVEKHDSTQDVLLQPGDRIVIPVARHTVLVLGQVVSPGDVPFIPGKDADYYIRQAGGFTDNARTGGVAIVKRSTRQWLEPGEGKVEDGDFVWVPKTISHDFGYYLNLVGQAASIVSVAVTVLLVVRTYR